MSYNGSFKEIENITIVYANPFLVFYHSLCITKKNITAKITNPE